MLPIAITILRLTISRVAGGGCWSAGGRLIRRQWCRLLVDMERKINHEDCWILEF